MLLREKLAFWKASWASESDIFLNSDAFGELKMKKSIGNFTKFFAPDLLNLCQNCLLRELVSFVILSRVLMKRKCVKRDDTKEAALNIQIFGTKKCNDTKKAERFFKERGIKYQFIDMKEKGMSKGEFMSVASANGGIEGMLDQNSRDNETLTLIKYLSEEDRLQKILENPQVIKTPVVRNGKQSTVGYRPEVWKTWE